MASAIVTKKPPSAKRQLLGRARRQLSPLTLRIMAVNALALAIMVASILYLARYQDRLIEVEIETLQAEAKIFATALAESATLAIDSKDERLVAPLARQMIRRLDEVTEARARLYKTNGMLLADSWADSSVSGGDNRKKVDRATIDQLPAEQHKESWLVYQGQYVLAALLPGRTSAPRYTEDNAAQPVEREEVLLALQGETGVKLWQRDTGAFMFSVAVPVQRYKNVLGVLNLTRDATRMAQAIRSVRADIIKLFIGALAITAILSLYLARAIAQPITQLSRAADAMRFGEGTSQLQRVEIPDFSARGDEIGDLSQSFRAMTNALVQRLTAIESFAADVAHEIKNPLASVQSAVETLTKIASHPEKQAQREKLLAIIHHDVQRLDRLITDISSASRLDAELSRTALETIDVGALLQAIQQIYLPTETDLHLPHSPVVLTSAPAGLVVMGFAGRLSQVLQNLIDNAISFSPMPTEDGRGTVRLAAARSGNRVIVTVEDDGPGIPENKLEAIFERFYSERPAGEAFGSHSGLGLSICKQIVEAHKGTITAANRKDATGNIQGAVFTVDLPAA